MKVLHVIPSLSPDSGGPSRSVPELCRALADTKTQVTLLSTHAPGDELTIAPENEPYEVVIVPAAHGSLAGARQIHRVITERSGEFDLIHIHSLWSILVTLAASSARKSGVPYIIAPRGMLSDACLRHRRYLAKRAYASSFDRDTVGGAARLHFLNSDELRSSQSNWFRYSPYFLARNGVLNTLEKIPRGAFRARFPELQGARLMLFMGRLHSIKGLDLQLRALERLLPKHPNLIWTLVGPDDGDWPRLSRLIREAGLEAHVKWTGPLTGNERFSAFVDADVLVQTSQYECQSMTVNEGLAVGVPLVVTESINYSEVQSSAAGYVVGRDAAAIAQAIDIILCAPDRGDAMRQAGRKFAAEELSWAKIAVDVNSAYEEILKGAMQHHDFDKHGSRERLQVSA